MVKQYSFSRSFTCQRASGWMKDVSVSSLVLHTTNGRFGTNATTAVLERKKEDLIPKVTSKPVGQFQGVKIKQNNFQLQSPRSPVASYAKAHPGWRWAIFLQLLDPPGASSGASYAMSRSPVGNTELPVDDSRGCLRFWCNSRSPLARFLTCVLHCSI